MGEERSKRLSKSGLHRQAKPKRPHQDSPSSREVKGTHETQPRADCGSMRPGAPAGSVCMRLIAALMLVLASTLGARAAFETVQIPGADQTVLRGVLYKPSGEGPFSAVVALHGCGGLG